MSLMYTKHPSTILSLGGSDPSTLYERSVITSCVSEISTATSNTSTCCAAIQSRKASARTRGSPDIVSLIAGGGSELRPGTPEQLATSNATIIHRTILTLTVRVLE